MVATFNGNPSTTIICYSPIYDSNKTDVIPFYNDLSTLVRSIPKHIVLIVGGDVNAQRGKNENNKFCLPNSSYKNGEHLKYFSLENGQTCLITKLQKGKENYEPTLTQVMLKHW